MQPTDIYKRQIRELEQCIENTGAAIENCFASTAILFISLTIASVAFDPKYLSLNSRHFINLVGLAILVISVALFLIGVGLMWHKKRVENKLRLLKETSCKTPKGVWPPAPQVPH